MSGFDESEILSAFFTFIAVTETNEPCASEAKEMAELNRQMGFAAVERDEHFSPRPLSAVRRR